MKKAILAVLFLLAGGIYSLFAQDIITLLNGNEIKAKVIEISSTEIRYKNYDNLDGPTIVLGKAEIFAIAYENGTREVINALADGEVNGSEKGVSADEEAPKLAYPSKIAFGLYVNPSGFLLFGPMAGLSLTTNRVITNLHMRLPQLGLLTPSLNTYNGAIDNSGGIGVGLGINYFHASPKGGLYAGIMVEYWTTQYSFDSGDPLDYWYADTADTREIAYCVNIGYRWIFSPGIFINLGGYVGATTNIYYEYAYKDEFWVEQSKNYTDGRTIFFGMVDLAIGFNFVK